MKTDKVLTSLWPEIVLSLLVLVVFFITVDTYQYLTTEVWWLWDETSFTHNTWFLLSLIVLGAFIPMNRWLVKWPKLGWLILGLFCLSLIGHQQYSRFYSDLQKYPKILHVSKDWGLPGSWVKIEGRNFGQVHQQGSVRVGESEMIIKKWEEKEIIFEIPVTATKDKAQLVVINHHQRQQQQEVGFEVR